MKVLSHSSFLTDLVHRVEQIQHESQNAFQPLDPETLNQLSPSGGWSIAQCLEHLNRYSRFYHSEIKQAIRKAHEKGRKPEEQVAYGFLGTRFIQMIAPGTTKNMKTRKHLDPGKESFGAEVVEEFLEHQHELLNIIALARETNLNQVKIKVEVMPMLKFRLGACLEFLVLHEERHLAQAGKLLRVTKGITKRNAGVS